MSKRSRGQLISKTPDTHLIRVHLGNRKYYSTTVHGSRREAEKVLTQKLREKDTSLLAGASSRMKVDPFLDQWLASKVPDLAARTHQAYTDLLRLHVRPTIGHLRLDQVSPLLLQQMVTDLSSRLSPRMVQYVATVTSQALKCAVQWRLLPVSPAVYLRLPKREQHEQAILSPEDVKKLWEGTEGTYWNPMWVLALTTGMRPQEYLALQWGDIEGNTVRVHRALVMTHPGHYEVGPVKTHRSRRALAVPDEVLAVLEAHRKVQRSVQKRLSPWVFCNARGNPWDMKPVRKAWKEALEAAGLPAIRLYSSRHTHLSHILLLTGNLKVVQERAGHSSIKLTGDTYSHLLEETNRETGELVGKLLFSR